MCAPISYRVLSVGAHTYSGIRTPPINYILRQRIVHRAKENLLRELYVGDDDSGRADMCAGYTHASRSTLKVDESGERGSKVRD